MMSCSEVAFSYAALILHQEGMPITAEKLNTLVKAANVKVDAYWPAVLAKLFERRSVGDLISSVGAGGGGGVAAVSAGPATSAAALAAVAPVEEKEETKEEESDDDMGFSLFD